MGKTTTPRKLAAILHADVAGYSRLMGADEEGTVKLLTEYRAAMAGCIEQHAGQVVDTAGDSLLAEFPSVVGATDCALELQHLLKSRNAGLPPERRLVFRMGIELADVLHEGDAVYGDGVNVAARIQALAEPGGICVSDAVRRAVSKRLSVSFESLGEHAVKNIAEPVRVFRVVAQVGWSPSHVGGGPVRRKSRIAVGGIVAAGAIVVALTGLLAVWLGSQKHIARSDNPTEDRSTGSADAPASVARMAFSLPEQPSVAVLPFNNISGDPAQEYLGDGLTENIITSLSQLPKLFVIASNSVFTYKDRPVRVQQVAEELGIRYVLEGSFQRSGDQIRIHAQFIDALTGRHLWAERYDAILTDLFALQDQVTQKIVSALQIQLTEQERKRLASRYTENFTAYDYFLRGQALYSHFTREDNAQARGMFEAATDLDPLFARAYGSLALTHVEDYRAGWDEQPDRSAEQAVKLAEKAVTLDASLPQTHFVRAYVYLYVKRRFDDAREHLRQAIALDPNGADGYALLGTINTYLGNLHEAARLIQRAIRLNPHTPSRYFTALGRALFFQGQYEQAIDVLSKATDKNPTFLLNHIYLAAAYQHIGESDKASWEVAEILALAPDFTVGEWLKAQPIKDPSHVDHLSSNLRKAGLR